MLISLDELIKKYSLKIKGIFHIGAHHCEERDVYLKHGIKDDNIIWVEANKKICEYIQPLNKAIKIYNAVITDKDNEEIDFIETNNGQSSSILELDLHKICHPEVHEIGRYKVRTKTADTLIDENKIDMKNINFLNIDIQGAELLALKGMSKNLEYIDYIYLEVNITSVYKNCALIGELDEFLEKRGYKRVETCMTSHNWGDAFYMRK